MPPSLSQLINPLVTPQQLLRSASQLHGMSRQLEEAVRYRASSAIQAVGILLRLPQQMIAQAIVIYLRFWLGTDGGSLLRYNAQVSEAKISELLYNLANFFLARISQLLPCTWLPSPARIH